MPFVLVGTIIVAIIIFFVYRMLIASDKKKKVKPIAYKYPSSYNNPHDLHGLLKGKKYHITAFAFNNDIMGIEDITALRMAHYREYGSIKEVGFNSDEFYNEIFVPDEHSVFDIGSILMHANETSRKDENMSLYFYNHLYPIKKISSIVIHNLYDMMRQKLGDDNTILLRVEKENDRE